MRRQPQRLYLLTGGAQGFTLAWMLPAVVWWVVDLRLSPFRLVLLGTALVLTILVAEAPTGVLADLYGRKRSVVAAYGVMGAAMLLMPVASTFALLICWQALWAVGFTLQSGAATAWMTDEMLVRRGGPASADAPADSEIDRLIVRHATWRALGIMVGVVPAGALGVWSLRGSMLVMGALGVAFAAYLAAVMPETGFRPERPAAAGPWRGALAIWRQGAAVALRRRTLLAVVLAAAIAGFAAEAIERLDVLRMVQLGLPEAGGSRAVVFFGVVWFVMTAFSLPVMAWLHRRLARPDERRDARLLIRLLLLGAAGAAALAVSPWFALALVGWTVLDVTLETTHPLAEAMANRRAPSAVRATVISFLGQAEAVGKLLGGLVLGAVAQLVSVPVALATAAAVLAVAALPLSVAARRPEPSPARSIEGR